MICDDIVKRQVKFCLLLDFLHNIISKIFSQHWRATWNQLAGRMRPADRGLDSTAESVESPAYTYVGSNEWQQITRNHNKSQDIHEVTLKIKPHLINSLQNATRITYEIKLKRH